MTGEAQVELAERIQSIRRSMSRFDESGAILDMLASLAEIETRLGTLSTKEEYEGIEEELEDMEDDLNQMIYNFNIDYVDVSGLESRWTYPEYFYDNDGNIIGRCDVLVLARSEEYSNEDILKDLESESSITFYKESITYEVERLEDPNYQALITATDPDANVVYKIYVTITEW